MGEINVILVMPVSNMNILFQTILLYVCGDITVCVVIILAVFTVPGKFSSME